MNIAQHDVNISKRWQLGELTCGFASGEETVAASDKGAAFNYPLDTVLLKSDEKKEELLNVFHSLDSSSTSLMSNLLLEGEETTAAASAWRNS